MAKEKNKGGRPTKLTPKFLKVAEEVLNEDRNALIFTDEELRDEINDRLKEDERVSVTRWEEWKAGKLKDPICEEFRGLMVKALRLQKKNLFKKYEEDDWKRYAWIIERKFGEWNLKNVSEVEHKGNAVQINLSTFTKQAKEVLDGEELHKIAQEQNRSQRESGEGSGIQTRDSA